MPAVVHVRNNPGSAFNPLAHGAHPMKLSIASPPGQRALNVISWDIAAHWHAVSPAARPYLAAMRSLLNIEDMYGLDTGESIVRYFLANAAGWRGDHARRLKSELHALLKMVRRDKQTEHHARAYDPKARWGLKR